MTRSRAIGIVQVLAVLTLLIAGASLWFSRQWRLSQYPEKCRIAATLEEWSELEVHAQAWVNTSPREEIAWFWLGQSLRGQERFAEALLAFQNVTLRGPRGIDAATARLEILFHVQQQPIAALQIADEILLVDPNNVDALRHRIYFDAMTMQRPQMVADIRRCIDAGGDLPEHYLYILSLEELWFIDGPEVIQKWLTRTPQSPLLQVSHLVQMVKQARGAYLTSPTP